MKEINDKFDKAETYVERLSKLILKIVTTLAALIVGIIFAWNQLKTTINQHVHQEDEQFQQYLKEIESEEVYNEGVVNAEFEDSVYKAFYHLDGEAVADTVIATPEPVVVVDTPEVEDVPVVVTLEVRETLVTETEVVDTPIITDMVVDTTVADTLITDTTITDTIEVRE